MPAELDRLRRMDGAELRWRAMTRTRAIARRLGASLVSPRWHRRTLARELIHGEELAAVRHALAANRWDDAHRALARHFATAPQRFLIAPSQRPALVRTVAREFPAAGAHAATRANRIVAGEYDLLGYQGLRWNGPDWHYDPVHGRRAPRRFWTAVPYLDAACGDHKVIWELNRHQHWLVLGRACWLTGDVRFRSTFIGQLESWLDANPPLTGINWASMLELAFRSLSWIWAIQFFAEPEADDRSPWLVDLLTALAAQLRHIERNLSHYFSPNTHLLGEGLALYVAGRVLPQFRSSARWSGTGRSILLTGIERQITGDGGHVERSAHYHRYALDFYLMALAIARITADDPTTVAAFERASARLAFACRLLADDRGRLPQLGDDDGGSLIPICGRAPGDARDSLAIASALVERPDLRIGQPPEEAFWFLAHPALLARLDRAASAAPPDSIGSAALPETGYYVSRSPSGDHVVIDAGPHGYQNGGHAHADALSLTFTVRGTPLLIDPGTGAYTIDAAARDRFRSSQAHNTVTIDDRSQSVPSGPFHWTRMANARAIRWRTNGGFDYLEGSHNGYAPIEHRRHVLVLHGDLLVVADLITCRLNARTGPSTDPAAAPGAEHTAAAHWHLDPRWSVEVQGRRARLGTSADRIDLVTPDAAVEAYNGDAETGLGWHAPVYGRVVPTTTLRVARHGPLPLWLLSVFALNPDGTIERVEYVPVWTEAGVLEASMAARIVRRTSLDYFMIVHPSETAAARARTWRVGELETDAHMLFCRVRDDGHVVRAAFVDGSTFRAGGRRVQVVVPRPVPDLHVDLSGISTRDPFAAAQARLSGPGFGARIVVNSRELPIAAERRASPRSARTVHTASGSPNGSRS